MKWYLKYGSAVCTDTDPNFSEEDVFYYLDELTTPDWISSDSLVLHAKDGFDDDRIVQFYAGTNKEVKQSLSIDNTVSNSRGKKVTQGTARRSSRRKGRVNYAQSFELP